MRKRGFTLVEVMMSIVVMTISALALFALMQQLIRGNAHARQLTTATQIAQNLIERLKLDAVRWTQIGDLTQTTYLRAVPAPGTIGSFAPIPTVVVTRAGTNRLMSNAFDFYGDDLDNRNGAPDGLFYCAGYRLSWVYANQRVMRADVRVFWPRDGQASIVANYPQCVDDHAALNPPAGANFNNYHVVYLSTVLRAY